jgi:hypothetical protein
MAWLTLWLWLWFQLLLPLRELGLELQVVSYVSLVLYFSAVLLPHDSQCYSFSDLRSLSFATLTLLTHEVNQKSF